MGVEVYGLSNDSLLNERIQCVEGLIMYSLEMNDMLSKLRSIKERNSIEIAIMIKIMKSGLKMSLDLEIN